MDQLTAEKEEADQERWRGGWRAERALAAQTQAQRELGTHSLRSPAPVMEGRIYHAEEALDGRKNK